MSLGLRVLQVAHGHTAYLPGGTEMVALALHRHWRSKGEDCWYLGAAEANITAGHPGTNMLALTQDQREAAIHVQGFARFQLEQPDYFGALREFRNYLDTIRPDVVHFHHVLNFGLEAIHLVRSTLPHAAILLTLHDYYLICASNGQLFKYQTGERCSGPRHDQCMKCIPSASAADLRMRELDIRRTLSLVDSVIAPSRFLAESVSAHIERCPPIAIVENTYVGPGMKEQAPRPRNGAMRFAYFGNLARVKGLGDLLAAAEILCDRGMEDFSLAVHGSQLYPDAELEGQLAAARPRLGPKLKMRGRYDQHELAARMAETDCVVFPSLWWENAPLVIYEALHFGKPVICYPHGGGAEILQRHGGGVLAETSSPDALADAMQKIMEAKVCSSAGLRKPLRDVDAFAAQHEKAYLSARNWRQVI